MKINSFLLANNRRMTIQKKKKVVLPVSIVADIPVYPIGMPK